jgi:hypothetical protein
VSLNGSLQDFDLSYIFQIISQEGKTGRLSLTAAEAEGFVIFKNGSIVSAGWGSKNVRAMMLQYLLVVKRYDQNEIREIDLQFKNNLQGLAAVFMQRQLFNREELVFLIQTGLEDITSSLFTWKKGNYSFTVHPNVDSFQVAEITIPADAVTMEAARREDELKRLQESVQGYKVYIHSDLSTEDGLAGWTVRPEETIKKYLYILIDGTSSVDYIARNSFLTEYRLYQELAELKTADKISALPDKLSRSINAALERKNEMRWGGSRALIFSSLVTAGLVIAVVLSGIWLRTRCFSETIALRLSQRTEVAWINTYQKLQVASLLFQSNNGAPLKDIRDLIPSKYIGRPDLKLLTSDRSALSAALP